MKEILYWIGGGVAALMTIVQLAPIKINPWGWLARKIGNAMNSDIIKQVNILTEQFGKSEKKKEEEKALECRYRILRFGDECRLKIKHSQELFDQALEDISDYLDYCRLHPDFKNNKTVLTIELIEDAYRKCIRENSFL